MLSSCEDLVKCKMDSFFPGTEDIASVSRSAIRVAESEEKCPTPIPDCDSLA